MGVTDATTGNLGVTTVAAAGGSYDARKAVRSANQPATIAVGANRDGSPTTGDASAATRSIVRVLVKATVRRRTRVSYVRPDGSRDDGSDGEAVPPGTEAPQLLLCSELNFVMSSALLLPLPSHNCG